MHQSIRSRNIYINTNGNGKNKDKNISNIEDGFACHSMDCDESFHSFEEYVQHYESIHNHKKSVSNQIKDKLLEYSKQERIKAIRNFMRNDDDDDDDDDDSSNDGDERVLYYNDGADGSKNFSLQFIKRQEKWGFKCDVDFDSVTIEVNGKKVT